MSGAGPIRLAVLGAGLVGARHARQAFDHPEFDLKWVVDPDPSREALISSLDCRWAKHLEDVPAGDCDAAVIATPNGDHLRSAMACLERRWATLVEKPIADSVENGEQMVRAFDNQGVPLLIGHHRRYHPAVEAARKLIDSGEIGAPVMASVIWAVRKPDSYFDAGRWRRNADGGPLLINFIHEADLMLRLFGPVDEVQAMASSRARGGGVEDTVVILIRFLNGVLASVTLTDAALSPWSFEGASGENPTIAETGVSSWRIGCTSGSFEFPSLRVWTDAKEGEGDWSRPLKERSVAAGKVDPLREQLTHFAELIRGEIMTAKVSGRDGLDALRLVEAVQVAAATRQPVSLRNTQQDAHVA